MGIYGPRTVFCLALADAPGCHEFLLQDDGKWVHVKETTNISTPLLHSSISQGYTGGLAYRGVGMLVGLARLALRVGGCLMGAAGRL
jgi:hypothetical protein